MEHEVIIIGSGPAGLTAGIYLARFKRHPLIIEGNLPGGQLMTTGAVENWPGDLSVDGPVLMKRMREQAEKCGTTLLADEVTEVDFTSRPFSVSTKHGKKLTAKSIVIATGSSPRKLQVPGEEEYWGKGVNVCATCDAPLYKDREVVVVGGGNSAIAESYALSKHAKKVTIIQVHDKLTATDPLTDKVLSASNVGVLYNKKVIEIKGDGERVTAIVLEDAKDKTVEEFSTEGVFVAIGLVPNSLPFKGQVDIDAYGYIVKTGAITTCDGVFVAGDVSDKRYRQAITASGQGCSAALECEDYLQRMDG
jgi:thioredoxin reductase (NADPH)